MRNFEWSISAAWGQKHLDCGTQEGIKRCKGACCSYDKFWPPRVGEENCKFITPKGCSLDMNNRPVTCLLYPFRLNKSNKLVLHIRITLKFWMCNVNYGKGPMVVVGMQNCFNALFGEKTTDCITTFVKDGRGLTFRVPENVVLAYYDEKDKEKACQQPSSRGKLDYDMLKKKYKYLYEGQEVFF